MRHVSSLRAVLFLLAAIQMAFAGQHDSQSFQRNYKASAYVSVLSIPIFSRSGVGFGFASADEQVEGEQRLLSLRFLSGSTPERAHGLNRFGFIQENVEQKNRATVEANYFGLMTASTEESLADAKTALNAKPGDSVPFVAARATINRERARYSVRHMLLPSSVRGSNADQLLRRVQAEFAVPRAGQKEKTELSNGQTIGTFLYSLQEAMQTEGVVYERRFIYNGKTFRLHADKKRDAKVGDELHKAGITGLPAAVTMMNGIIRNEKTNEATNFRLWFERGSPNFLPLRFEFKPKSYLRLVFDAEPPSLNRLAAARGVPQ